jgi:PA domain
MGRMSVSRRSFMKWAATVSTLAVSGPAGAKLVPLFRDAHGAPSGPGEISTFHPELLPSQKEVWTSLEWMAKLGPKYTGNPAHTEYVNWLATQLQSSGLQVERDHYSFPRWSAKRWEISVAPKAGGPTKIPVTSYFPYSGETPPGGVTGELVYAGANPDFKLEGLQGKIVLVDFAIKPRDFATMYKPWGIYPADAKFPSELRPARGAVNDLTQFQKAGAVAVILAWTDVSDANAADQYTPFSRPPQGVPGVYVGRDAGARLKALCGTGAKATVVLDADITPDTPTDTVIATLPGTSADEVIVVNTHTDGPNATEENGGVAIVALAKYFSKIPLAERKRTLVFPLTTGHFAGPWVPSIRGFVEKHPETMKKAVAALTIEHLGCMEWMDNASFQYKPTGEIEWSVAISEAKGVADILVDALQGSGDRRTGVVNPVHGGWLGEGSALAKAGIPTIGYIPQPNYLLAGPANGCIEKLNSDLLYSQVQVFAKVIHKMDLTGAAELKGGTNS